MLFVNLEAGSKLLSPRPIHLTDVEPFSWLVHLLCWICLRVSRQNKFLVYFRQNFPTFMCPSNNFEILQFSWQRWQTALIISANTAYLQSYSYAFLIRKNVKFLTSISCFFSLYFTQFSCCSCFGSYVNRIRLSWIGNAWGACKDAFKHRKHQNWHFQDWKSLSKTVRRNRSHQ